MEKIYEKADDQHVRSIIVYGKATTADSTTTYSLYANPEFTEYLNADEIADVFAKGMLVVDYTVSGSEFKLPVIGCLVATASDPAEYRTLGPSADLITWTVAVES